MVTPNSPEFTDVLAAWIDALKVMDTKLNAYYTAVASLENSEFAAAAPFFKDAVLRAQEDPRLVGEMTHKYDLALRKLRQLIQQSGSVEALSSWLREYRV